jgi:hypothetical protein
MLVPYSPFRMLIACTYDFDAAVLVWNVGATPVPFDVSNCPEDPTLVEATAYPAG